MRLEELRSLLPMEAEESDALYSRFCEQTGLDDPDHFLAWLFEREHVGSETFRALHVHGDLSLPGLEELSFVEEDAYHHRFRELGLLGHGAMGEVHVAQERDLRRKVAVKRLLPELSGDSTVVRRFFREIQITAQLEHPNIVPIYSLETDEDGTPSCSMKLIQGKTLAGEIREARESTASSRAERKAEQTHRLEHFLKVCDALAYAHSKGIIHRDLKPSNIMIGPYNEVYVMDWGIARRIRGADVDSSVDEDEDEALEEAPPPPEELDGADPEDSLDAGETFSTRVGTVVGTPHYMSPEQAFGRTDLDGMADQYALGLVLFELITLRRANPGESVEDALENAMDALKAPYTAHGSSERVAPELVAIVDRATELEPEDRYEDVRKLAADLRRYLRGEAVRARPDNAVQALLRWISHNRAKTLVLLATIALVALGSMTWSVVREQALRSASQAREEALGAALTTVSGRAARIDRELQRYQGLLEGLASASVQALELPEAATASFLVESDFEDPSRAPSDFAPASRYGRAVSTERAVQVLAPGVDSEQVRPLMGRLATLESRFPLLISRSHPGVTSVPDRERVRELLTEEGVPIVWAYVALEEGIHAAYPGKAGYPDDYDPRKRPWYALSAYRFGPQWGNAYLDSLGQGLLLPCTMALYDKAGDFRGVAGVELTFDWIVDNLLELEDLPGLEESFLLDDSGHVVVRSSYDEGAETPQSRGDSALELPLFEEIAVVAALLEGRSGYLELPSEDGSRLVAWYRMSGIGWYYAVTADAEELLEASQRSP